MIGSREGPLAESALERPISGVLPVVAGELIRSGEFPPASLPGALIRLLPRVRPQMGFKMRRFRVRLGASGMRTGVNDDPSFTPRPPASRTDGTGSNCCSSRSSGRRSLLQIRRGRRSESRCCSLLSSNHRCYRIRRRIVGRLMMMMMVMMIESRSITD